MATKSSMSLRTRNKLDRQRGSRQVTQLAKLLESVEPTRERAILFTQSVNWSSALLSQKEQTPELLPEIKGLLLIQPWSEATFWKTDRPSSESWSMRMIIGR